MAKTTFHPSWWSEQKFGSAWDRVKAAMHRDWEQTKGDFSSRGPDLNQDVNDTVRQAFGKQPISFARADLEASPGAFDRGVMSSDWEVAESPLAYGFAARTHYGATFPTWDDKLESALRKEWEASSATSGRTWQDVRLIVRRGFDAPRIL
jgi:hypothetical protein